MPTPGPSECPACGHAGINRTSAQLDARFGQERRPEEWSCRLCAYTWSSPKPPRHYGDIDSVRS
jgi:hypothetical protein